MIAMRLVEYCAEIFYPSATRQQQMTRFCSITEVKHVEINQFSVGWNLLGVGNAAIEQISCKANMDGQGHGKFGPVADPNIPSTQKWYPHVYLTQKLAVSNCLKHKFKKKSFGFSFRNKKESNGQWQKLQIIFTFG